ncbi:hypothetical protein LWI28_019432 [Acer negundo]|uniref:Rho termination factor-like N-terminal domain-containing protein n=1 Tax=Acer negundo TaxID=4023 RepID=A0AAD5IG67_ACENE|nr:hypothetical protein LWI28_019432 [Acer negundo]
MAFDINNLSLAPQDSSCYAQPGWHCDFYFGYGCDVIEEDALNEKYCIQVLRILITKTDTEINELEKDLVSLQSELAWAEYEEWPDICCNALRKKIDSLHISVRNLKNKDKNNTGVHLSIIPAESLHEIVKALLGDLFQETAKQNEELLAVAVLDRSDSQGQATEDLEENKKHCSAGSSVIVKGEIKESSFTPLENGSMLKTSLTLQEDETNNLETVKLVSNFSQDPSELAPGHPDEKILLGSFELENARKGEEKECGFTPKKKKTVQDSSLKAADESRQNLEMVEVQAVKDSSIKAAGERRQNLEMVEVQPADIKLKNSCRITLKHAVNYSKRKKPLNISDSKIINEQAKEVNSISAAGKGAIIGKKVKRANATVRNIRADALRDATGLSRNRNNSDSKLATTSGKAKGGNSSIINSVLRHPSGLIGRINNTDPGLATSRLVKVEIADGSAAALRHATGLNQQNDSCDSRLGAIRQENGGNCDMNQKLCDFTLKVARKRFKESNSTLADKTDSSCSSSEAEGNKKHSQIIVKVEKVDLTDTRHSTLTPILELQDGKGMESTKTLPEKGTIQPELQLAETATNNEKFNLDLSVKPQNQKAKRKTESSSLNVQEPVFLSAKMVVSNSPSVSKAKRLQKAGLGSESSGSNQSWDRKTMKKNIQYGQCEAEENSSGLNGNRNLNLQHQKKRKKNSSLPIAVEIKGSTLQMDISKSQSDPNDSTGKDDLLITESYSKPDTIDSCTEAVPSSPSATSKLNDLKVNQLRAIAKEKKLTNYYKLRRSDLIERIANHQRC